MKKYKINELFDEVDKMREDIETNKVNYESLSNEFMLMIDPNYKKDNSIIEPIDDSEDNPEVEPEVEPVEEVKEVKTKKVTVKKVNKKKSNNDLADV